MVFRRTCMTKAVCVRSGFPDRAGRFKLDRLLIFKLFLLTHLRHNLIDHFSVRFPL